VPEISRFLGIVIVVLRPILRSIGFAPHVMNAMLSPGTYRSPLKPNEAVQRTGELLIAACGRPYLIRPKLDAGR
jgi:hypothetical protein